MSSLYFVDPGNMSNESISTQEPPQEEKSEPSSISTSRDILLILIGSVYFLNLLVNLRAIHTIYGRLSKRMKKGSFETVLVGHLSLICVGITFLSVVDICKSEHLVEIFGPLIYKVGEFFEDSFVCAFAINTLLIANEREQPISDYKGLQTISDHFCLLWFIAFLQGFLTLVWSSFRTTDWGKPIAIILGVPYEGIRFVFLHLDVGYTIYYGLLNIHEKMGELEMPNERFKSKMKYIRCFYIHLGIFVTIWISYGLWLSFLRCAYYLGFDVQPIGNIPIGFHAYLILHPLVYILILDGKFDYLCLKGRSGSDEEWDEETGTGTMDDDEYSQTPSLTTSEMIEELRRANSYTPSTSTRKLSSSSSVRIPYFGNPSKQTNVEHWQAANDFNVEYIDEYRDNEPNLERVVYNAAGQPKKVSFSDTNSTYFDDEKSVQGEVKRRDSGTKGKETAV